MEKNQNQINTVAEILNFAKDRKSKFVSSVILAIIGVLFGMLPYLSAAKIIAAFYNKEASLQYILIWGGLAILAYILKGVFCTSSTCRSHEGAFAVIKNVRADLLAKMERVPMGVMVDTPSGNLKTLVVDVTDKLEKPLAHMLPEMVSNILIPLIMLIILFILDWRLALTTLAVIPIGFIIFCGQLIGYKVKSKRYADANDAMNASIIEYVTGIEVIKAFNQSASSYGKYTESTKNFRDTTLDWWRGCWFFSAFGNTIISATLLVTLPVGAMLFMQGQIDFDIFITCITMAFGITGPLIAASGYAESFAVVAQSVKQVREFLDQPELIRPQEKVTFTDAQFKFQDVHFGYKEKEILHGINFESVPKGVTAIVGPSGGGKSTIAKLMAGFWDINSGSLTYGGQPISKIPMEQMISEISYVAQDNYLFDRTIMENIRMGRPDASDDEVIETAKAAGCHDFIMNLEKGYQTMVGDAGGKLSGGERQRITIARAMMKKASVVILDEATAYADPENEAIVQQAINKLVAGKTLIVIAHRLSTIKNADKIVVVEDGKIIAQGKQEELLASCPLYKKMWDNHISASVVA
ncbi:MAG: ABC transporter ATP-binding protein/permease [Treponema sp.]|nr:ABC transporter ATP-binding protein/permease [Treponema sp.]